MKGSKIAVLKALADPTRLSLLERIRRGRVCACELPKVVRTSQPAVSQHLKVLRDAGLVGMEKEGVKRLYSLSPKGKAVLAQLSEW
jgi:DNA-binding transcriptional ArsR family regulator